MLKRSGSGLIATLLLATNLGMNALVLVGIFSSAVNAVQMLRSKDNHQRLRRVSADAGIHCGCMECDYNAWHTLAVDSNGAFTCGARIAYLVYESGMTEEQACVQVGQNEFPSECGSCSPVQCTPRTTPRCGCPYCDDIWEADADDHTCGARITWLQTSTAIQETFTEEEACRAVGGDQFPNACKECNPDVCTPLPTSPGAHCGCKSCDSDAWDTIAGGPSCGERIQWLQASGMSEKAACELVANVQFRGECGACNPNQCPLRDTPRCGCQECETVWDVVAGGYSCGARITWLQTSSSLAQPYTEEEACLEVGATQFPQICGACACNGGTLIATSEPTNAVTPAPISQPTQNPTPIPTRKSKKKPTSAPTLISTRSPTPVPTSAATPRYSMNSFDFGVLMERTDGMATLLPPKHIHQSLIYTRAIPTSKWWTNMIAADPFNPNSDVNFPVYSHPYRLTFNYYRDKDFGLHVCYSSDYRIFLDNSENGVPRGYTHGYGSDFVFSAVDFVTEPTYTIVDWDDYTFGVTVKIEEAGGDGVITTDLVTGMPFVSAQYQGLTPKLSSIHQILTVNNQAVATGTTISGTKFLVTNNKGQKWVIYTSTEIEFTVALTSLGASSPFDDITIRIALIPDGVPETSFDPYWTCIVTGGALEIYNDRSYGIIWNTKGDCSSGLLHLGFPHHDEVLDKEQVAEAGFSLVSATRGNMKAYVTEGSSTLWTMNEVESIPVNGFFAPRSPDQGLLQLHQVGDILEEEILDTNFLLNGGSYYFTGKSAQKYATMCLLATEPSVNTDVTLADSCLNKLKDALDAFLRNAFSYPLVYDDVYRGVISSEGIVRGDVNVDFGNTVYNDHHFHYGYWIFTGAVLKHLDPGWDRMPELNLLITSLIRDTANSDILKDPHFPLFRHFDWFAGHSSSHGLVPVFDGKDQESTSEAMNFYYSLSLWGAVSNDSDLVTLGNLMMKVGKRSMGQYLLLENSNKIHPQIVGNKVVGILFENKVDYTTWFGNKREYMHGIQMIPVSPINEFLRTSTFVTEEWVAVLQNLDLIADPENHRNNSWQSLLFANYAVVNKANAMDQLSKVTLDGGLSRAWAMYFAVTRP
ncbi:glycosyl hydrolase family 81 protein [Nitzschia inconspicua]|uniref:glucan endo-1,3-beta-D-glucosidase n=1 Tax=Nitzschia inconspicua TaxID=303405 RepID=A0A9K3PJK6_9STRA|nr:glycosyl hydrolase family 81 protein [Nitzschia inconspicua]